MTANRVAAAGGTVAAVAAAVVSVLGEVDSAAKAVVVSVALVCLSAVVVMFLRGSQKWDALKGAAKIAPLVTAQTSTSPGAVVYHPGSSIVPTVSAMGAFGAGAAGVRAAEKHADALRLLADPLPVGEDPLPGDDDDGDGVARELNVHVLAPNDPSAIPPDQGDARVADNEKLAIEGAAG